jgi:predicted cupin superfamily sugar epimerase
METNTAQYWIATLNLQPHPEGGYYKETFRSQIQLIRTSDSAEKQACTSIYYLLEDTDYSGFHRIGSDEIWYFHKGSPLHIHAIDQSGNHTVHQLSDQATGNLSVIIPAGQWFAAHIPSQKGFTLVSCAVAPAFDFNEFEMAKKQDLLDAYPKHVEIIERLCRE